MPRLPLSAALLALLTACAQPPGSAPQTAACQLIQIANLPVTFINDEPTVPVTIAGHPLRMMIDTGAETSLITPATFKKIRGTYAYGSLTEENGVNGSVSAAASFVGRFQLGDITVENEPFFVAALDPSGVDGAGHADGVIGEDILHVHNIALDFPHHRIALYREDQCTSAFPWAGQFAQLPLSTDSAYSPMIPFAIDGTRFKATLDTGAVKTLIAARFLANKAVKPTATVSGETSIGIGGLAAPVAVERFATVTIGGEVFGPSWLRVAASPGAMDETDALLGEDYIRDHQIYIANDTGAVFLGTRIIPVP